MDLKERLNIICSAQGLLEEKISSLVAEFEKEHKVEIILSYPVKIEDKIVGLIIDAGVV